MLKRMALFTVLMISVFSLAGCFRQADDSFQPVTVGDASGSAQSANATSTTDAVFVPVTSTPDPLLQQPTPTTDPLLQQPTPTTDPLLQQPTPTTDPLLQQPTPTIDPIIQQATDNASAIVEQPTIETPLPLDPLTQPTNDPNAPMIVTVAPSATPEVVLASATPEVTLTQPTSDGAFITPGVPSFPSEIVTDTPAPLVEPTVPSSVLVTPTALPEFDENCVYIVRGGDSLYRIAIIKNTTVSALRRANPQLVGDLIRPGQRLNLPDCQSSGMDAGLTPAPTELVQPTTPSTVSGIEYVVRAGDTLYGIALRYGVTVQAIVNANNITNPDRLRIGQRLIIPTP